MAHGLFWLPLLILFSWLAWAGWNEYQKLEAYRLWAAAFDRAKYDIYAVLGQKGNELTWGLPNRQGPTHLETFSLADVTLIRLLVNGTPVEGNVPPQKGRAELEFLRSDNHASIRVPFTETSLASQWGQHLQQELQKLSGAGDGHQSTS
jgi:hypothetical protein